MKKKLIKKHLIICFLWIDWPDSKSIEIVAFVFFFKMQIACVASQFETETFVNFPAFEPKN